MDTESLLFLAEVVDIHPKARWSEVILVHSNNKTRVLVLCIMIWAGKDALVGYVNSKRDDGAHSCRQSVKDTVSVDDFRLLSAAINPRSWFMVHGRRRQDAGRIDGAWSEDRATTSCMILCVPDDVGFLK